MRVEDALLQLQVTIKRATKTVYQVIHSARANAAHSHGLDADKLIAGFNVETIEYKNINFSVSLSKEFIFGRFPYFLPSFAISMLAAVSCIACIWLPETLHFHGDEKVEGIDELEAQVGDLNEEGGKAKESRGDSTRNLLKNWQLMSAVIIYCVFSLYNTAYLEILSILLIATYPFMTNLQGTELKILVNIASVLKNMFATQEQRGVANGISVTPMSIFKAVALAVAGILFSWAQKHITGLFLPD